MRARSTSSNPLSPSKLLRLVVVAALIAAGLALGAGPAAAGSTTYQVTSGADDGPGTLRDAVDQANGQSSDTTIVIDAGLTVELTSPVVYTANRELTVTSEGATITGAGGDAAANSTWDSGLLVMHSHKDLTLEGLTFEDSFNNGVAVFIPSWSSETSTVTLTDVTITGSKFHGLFVDGQSSSGYNTDDVLHPACVDPHPFDSAAEIELLVTGTSVNGNGTLAGGYDDSIATGCPRDFDGIRVDDGGDGSITADLRRSNFDENLADGVELDETGPGGVDATVRRSTFDRNGESGTTIDGLEDLDDGFDIDEADAGSIDADVRNTSLSDNRDEGMDFDEAGPGDVYALSILVNADGNEDEGLKADEEDGGSLQFYVVGGTASGSLSQDGVDLTEAGDGDFDAAFLWFRANGNDNDGINAAQEDAGTGTLAAAISDLSGNGGVAVDADPAEITVTLTGVLQ